MNSYDVETLRLGHQRELMLAHRQRDALLAALQAALPMLDAWLNGDGTGIDMNEWDAATMLCRAALAKATEVQS